MGSILPKGQVYIKPKENLIISTANRPRTYNTSLYQYIDNLLLPQIGPINAVLVRLWFALLLADCTSEESLSRPCMC